MITDYNRTPTMYHGRIESVDDPSELHRVQVRVFELHDVDETKVPKSSLPWLQPLFAMNNPNGASSPVVGDWVLVYFPDPKSPQSGYVMGVLPGLVSGTTITETVTVNRTPPVKPVGDPSGKSGLPSTPPLARRVVAGTGVDTANKRLVHVCDITHETNRVANSFKRKFGEFVAYIKEGIQKLLKALGLADPSGEKMKLTELIKDVARQIKKVTKFLKDVNTTIAEYLKIVAKIKAMITYILSMPAKLLAEFQQCLANLYKSLLSGFATAFSGIGDVADLTELSAAVNEVIDETNAAVKQVALVASTPQQLEAVVLSPSSEADLKNAELSFNTYMSSPTVFSDMVPAKTSLVASSTATSINSSNITDSSNGKMP